MRDDFVEVFPNLPADCLLRKTMLRHMRLVGGGDRGIVGQGHARKTAFLQLVPVQAGAKLVDEPPSFFNCAYPMPLSREIRIAIGGCVANRSASHPSLFVSRRPNGSQMQRCAAPRLIDVVGAADP